MEKSLFLASLCIGFGLLHTVSGFPIDFSTLGAEEPSSLWLTSYFLTATGFLLGVIAVVFGCVCCRNGKGFKEFSNSSGNLAISRPEGFVNPASNSELTIFPPAGANSNQICRFEPLPDIKPQAPNLRPAAFSYSEREISSQDWFSEPYNNFPRNQLKYVQEYGRGWFGRVVEGEAQNITNKEKMTKVMVKILHEDATPTDQMYFLHEVKFYRDLKHPNILRLLGRCLETEPFLIILECYPNGDLKTFLSQNLASARALAEQGVTLQMCSNITSGLQYMHDNKFIHTDLAARNCLVGPDLTVKIGDYGNSIEIFKSDYYCAGSVALPIRWCAPETLKCTDVTIETREVTPPANIWSLAVVFWEICEFCKLPYAELNDDQVIVRVLGEKNFFLEKPNMFCLHKEELYHLMKLCWNSPVQRPTASQIYVILDNLISSSKTNQNEVQIDSKRISQDFEQRWQNLKPNYIPKRDNAVEVNSANCNIISSKLKNAKVVDSSYVDSPFGIFMSNKSTGQESLRFCLKSEKPSKKEENSQGIRIEENGCGDADKNNLKELQQRSGGEMNVQKKPEERIDFEYHAEEKPPEILNPDEKVKRAAPDVDSWLKGVEINNEEDESFVMKISEAIRDLDATLAMEKTSSSEENSGRSSHQNSPGKDLKENAEAVVDFKLGSDTSSFMNFTQKTFELSSLQNTEQPQSLNFAYPFLSEKKNDFDENYGPNSFIMTGDSKNIKNEVLDESLKENDSLICTQSRNSSDTDDEIWRKRIERGEISEKVKEKSKSIANLMILTHIDASDDSDIDLDKPFDKGLNRNSFLRRSGSFAKSSLSSNNFGSENDISCTVLEDDFKESLKKLSNDHKEHGHFDSLGMILPTSVRRENVWENLFKVSDPVGEGSNGKTANQTDVNKAKEIPESEKAIVSNSPPGEPKPATETSNNFLGNVASEKSNDNKVEISGNSGKGESEGLTRSEKDILTEASSKCDSTCNSPSCNSSYKNSSHLEQASVKIPDYVAEDLIDDFSSPLPNLNHKNSRNPLKIGNGSLNEIQCAETEEQNNQSQISFINVNPSVPTKTPDSRNVPSENVHVSDAKNPEVKTWESINSAVIPEIITTEAEKEKAESPEEVFQPMQINRKPFRFVLKDSDFIPHIKITEEPEEESSEEEEKFEYVRPAPKSFKFVLKDNEPVLEEDARKLSKKLTTDPGGEKPYPFPLECKCVVENDGGGKKMKPNDNSTVIIGACEDFTLDYFKGLKTTSEDMKMEDSLEDENDENTKNLKKIMQDLKSKEENLEIWDKHLEKTFTQQLDNADFNDISFKSFTGDLPEVGGEEKVGIPIDPIACPMTAISDFINSEKIHTEKVEEPIHINQVTNLTGTGSEEEYENFKLRTPDDERSSDSGFRDKGSLSESVEDACEGKYNLEDIEAELEEAYVKGAFGNCEVEKESEKDPSKNYNNFEYEESKFYEDENKNEEDFSDIDGEIEFWQNKDNSDYYPEISEFNPTCSRGWYLHPPDDNSLGFNSNVNEDIVNALRNELRESLPVQTRTFDEFNDFYEHEIDDGKRELNIHYITDFGVPLSPIIEEQDSSLTARKNIKNCLMDEKNSSKVRKSIVNLMESVKSIDTNTFMQYLDYMIENEGRDLDEMEELEEKIKDNKEDSPMLIVEKEEPKNVGTKNFKEEIKNALGVDSVSRSESFVSDAEQNNSSLLLEDLELGSVSKVSQDAKTEDDILVVNIDTNEVTLLESPKPKAYMAFMEGSERKDDPLEVVTDNSENDGLIFTPEMLSPDRDRSLSEISRSSNGTRTGDALSDITLSSPDLVPDCFSTSVQEILQNNEASEIMKELEDSGIINETDASECPRNLNQPQPCSLPKISATPKVQNDHVPFFLCENASDSLDSPKNLVIENREKDDKPSESDRQSEANDLYEMSTSFMGDEDDEEDEDESSPDLKQMERISDQKAEKESGLEDTYTGDWESESSGGEEEMSSSSGEFIWKEGDKELKVKAFQATGCDGENSLQEKSLSDQIAAESTNKNHSPMKESPGKEKSPNAEDDDDDDDNESSTGSSTSITDFVPSAWNSQATPGRSALKSPNRKTDQQQQKKSVWFKKQKYHCVYEYPREPSDNEDAEESPYNKFTNYDSNASDGNKHFTFGVNTVELPNKHFPYGISNVIDYSSYADWDILEGEEGDLSLTDTDSDNGLGKSESTKGNVFNFYNLSPFDYDFNSAGILNGDSEFFVSSSSRPFQGSSSSQFFPGNQTQTIFKDPDNSETSSKEVENLEDGLINSKDFVTPDSGLEDSTNVSPLEKKVELDGKNSMQELQEEKQTDFKPGILNLLDNLKLNFSPEIMETNMKKTDVEAVNGSKPNGNSNSPTNPLSPAGLGELRHARDKLKLDLPHSHNAELGAIINKKNQQNSLKL